MITNPKVYLTWQKGWFSIHFQSFRFEPKSVFWRSNTCTSAYEPSHRAYSERCNRADFYNHRGKQWRWLFLSLYKTGYISAACFEPLKPITEVTVEGKSCGICQVDGSCGCPALWLSCCGSQQAKSTDLTGQKKHKEAVLWVCRSNPGTGSVTNEESTNWSQETMTEHFLGCFVFQ